MNLAELNQEVKNLFEVTSKPPVFKIDGKVTPEYSAWVVTQTEAKKVFLAKYGTNALTCFNMARTLKTALKDVEYCVTNGTGPRPSGPRLLNSKGNGYGNGTF